MKVIIDCENLLDREQAHEYLEQMLDFPQHYGKNLDALYDCLTELSDCTIVLLGEEALSQDSYGARVRKVMGTAAQENPRLKLEIVRKNKTIKWLFFDLGSTLIDESACLEYRIQELLKQPNAPSREALEHRMIELASQNRLPYKDAAKEFGLETVEWPKHLEKMYKGVPELLEKLAGRYRLGIIANQSAGTEQRLVDYGIRQYFDIIMSSAEVGISKPDLKIFRAALGMAECIPDNAYMIGDRLDNDIEPAAQIGMHTIWVKQASFAYGNLNLIQHKPDHTVDSITDVLEYL